MFVKFHFVQDVDADKAIAQCRTYLVEDTKWSPAEVRQEQLDPLNGKPMGFNVMFHRQDAPEEIARG